MNKFRILGVIVIIVIIVNFFGGLDENWRDFKKGFEDGYNSVMEIYEFGCYIIFYYVILVKLNVELLFEIIVDLLSNNCVDWIFFYIVIEIEMYVKLLVWYIFVMGFVIFGIFFFFIGFCLLIWLFIFILCCEVFIFVNVWCFCWFVYISVSLEIFIVVDEWIVGNVVVE